MCVSRVPTGGVQPAAVACVSSQRFCCYESRSSIFVAHSPRFFFASPSIFFFLLPLFVDPARRTTVGDRLFVQTFDSNSKGYPTDDALVGCYVLGKTLGRSADLKVKNETLFYFCCRSGLYGVKWRRSHD
ncbi:hypothetical protein EVAR_69423_1 [Eumeta japonica]|uniref:Uncharacterized protein n=1 Tax=Eumeta variegata TaxID=151549 RepID=A0A4C1ZE27_EUMVA|nr:hypothetical protein EVAR_69423_1 [Eumeta japonica]